MIGAFSAISASWLVFDSQSLRPLSPGARAASPRKNGVGVVENARSAFSTTPTPSGERRRREQAIVIEIRQPLMLVCFLLVRKPCQGYSSYSIPCKGTQPLLSNVLARRRDTMLALVNTPSAPIPVELHEVAEPEPAPDEAIVEVHAFSLNRGELALLAGRPEGWRPGQDIAGVVVKAAADGSGPKEGTRVVALVDGAGWAQRAAAHTARMATLPDNVSFASAATLPVSGLTALRTLRYGGSLLGHFVLITAASADVYTLPTRRSSD